MYFLYITKTADFRLKNADVSRTHGVCYMIYRFFGSSLDRVQLWQVSSL